MQKTCLWRKGSERLTPPYRSRTLLLPEPIERMRLAVVPGVSENAPDPV
jgi:hypothetical protein